MKSCFRRHRAKIRKVSKEQADRIIDTRQPVGLFYSRVNKGYIGIDNSNGYAWTEEFSSLRKCRRWLSDPNLILEEI
ncbi:MAG: hypothetical protein FWG42_12230 [Clostridiales bacterium]|nr:hypothetical protein [Clostridiales bacterium]